ncbi:RecQ family ATP-dependent DNA helicase [Zobellella aerophila]|uniref:RecQ family ATP-dependent DNA helicase n=1 Tax=Zobellella aerophila TaxID=870480 RepID=UPI0031EB0C37
MILSTLQNTFGFSALRHGQRQVIEQLVGGQSAAAIFPTGSGKSLCYQLPALLLPHLTLVVSPLLALMKDQLDFLHSKGIAAASIDSSQSPEQSRQVMQAVREGRLKVLMISVERLKNERFRRFIGQIPISLLVVDEAHCISEWGHNFRPDYLKLPHYRQSLNIPQVLLLTATATPAVIGDMQRKFAIPPENLVSTGFYRPNLHLQVLPMTEYRKIAALIDLIADDPLLATIIYVTLQQGAEWVAEQLQAKGIEARAYHAGMNQESRQRLQQDFMRGRVPCIVATIAFGMGVDKADIRRVIHYDLPKSIENYSQEIGRAGRDGQPSNCTLLANKSGLNVLENFVYGDTPEPAAIAGLLHELQQAGPHWELMLTRLSNTHNIRQLPLKTLLVYLELDGIISPQYSYFADYRFKFIESRENILGRFQGERQAFLNAVFDGSPLARSWCQVDFEAIWQRCRGERKRVVSAIDYLHEQGWIQLESKQMVEVYRVVDSRFSPEAESERLYGLFKQKEQNEIDRLQQMIGFFESEQCLSHRLAGYFADPRTPERCGHCSVCAGQPAVLPDTPVPDMPDNGQLQGWCQPLQEKHGQPLSAHTLACFLCGIGTPLLTRLKARSLAGFGRLEQYRFGEVVRRLAGAG